MTDLATLPGGALQVADLAETFGAFLRLRVAEGDASPHTVRAYATHAAQYASWCQRAGIEPRTAGENDITDYRRHLVASGYARGTIALKLAAVRRLYAALVWRGLRTDDPAAGLKAPRDKTDAAERIKFLPLDSLTRLPALCDATTRGRRNRAIITLLGMFGLRVSEIAGLTLADLDRAADPPALRVVGKGRKTRTIYLTPGSGAVLDGWLQVRGRVAGPDVAALFVNTDNAHAGEPMTARGIRKMVDGKLCAAGLKRPGVSCHSLRHTMATWSVMAGASMPAIGAMLGHADQRTTGQYARVADRIRQNPAAYLERLLQESAGAD